MRIYRMTATFGKLEKKTLELTPGLNIIHAPNEWGKSTWCAFLIAMLYGLDTRAKSTKSALADKERYAPWSGSPMVGRIDLNWKGRDITIERATVRRVPLGDFKAYETDSGLPVPELTAANCGQTLLGVEQSVFRRSGFIRHADLPVTQDEALRRRLNALVTTGDESDAADRLAESLKDLKNRCRYNRSGLLPQAEAQREALENKIAELDALDVQSKRLAQQLAELQQELDQLQNHRQALAYAKQEEDTLRVAQARQQADQAEKTKNTLETACASLPTRETAQQKVLEYRNLREQLSAMEAELRAAPHAPQAPILSVPFYGMRPEEAQAMVRRDSKAYQSMRSSKLPLVMVLVGVLGLLAGAGLLYIKAYAFAALAAAAGLCAFVWSLWEKRAFRQQIAQLEEKYGTSDVSQWMQPISDYLQEMREYTNLRRDYDDIASDLEVRLMVLRKKRETLCGHQEPEALMGYWSGILEQWEACAQAQREAARAQEYSQSLSAMLRTVERPQQPDSLTWSEAETRSRLADCAAQQQHLQNRLGQYQGRMELLGDKTGLEAQLDSVSKRIEKLEQTYAALAIAQDTLAQARAELQRRFAPRITKRAQELLGKLTLGRYQNLTMGEDFSLQAGTGEEAILREALWRSDGTVDQLYLSLRLAVAEELMPDAPLVLDDVLVRFDDTRRQAALKVLEDMAQTRQVICFTCQKLQ